MIDAAQFLDAMRVRVTEVCEGTTLDPDRVIQVFQDVSELVVSKGYPPDASAFAFMFAAVSLILAFTPDEVAFTGAFETILQSAMSAALDAPVLMVNKTEESERN